ncbi:MAG TPA: ATP-binding protein [Gaiellaceae bacterium]|nr:ATP-binding protein [Gaiellaceae bacterium]
MRARQFLVRALVSVSAVAVVTGVVFGLKDVAPVLSLGVLYIFAVLPVAIFYGLAYAIGVSVLSMLAFNFFFLPPLHTLAMTDSENWVALAVFLVTSVVVSQLAIAAADAEALRRSDAAKTAILHAVSHDLRSPLTAIRAASDGLESSTLDLDEHDRAELLETIRLETSRLERLVGNLLDLSRLEAGAAQPQPQLWPVDELVSGALDSLGADAARVSVRSEEALPPVRVDAVQLERALANVLENALRLSSPTDRVDVTVSASGDQVFVRVDDRGPGLANEDLGRIFQPFEGRSGTGLGLAIARGFAEANGSRLWAEPRHGSGARFVFALPAAPRPVTVGG